MDVIPIVDGLDDDEVDDNDHGRSYDDLSTPKAPPLTVQPTLGGLAPMLKRMRPFGSFVRNLNDMVPVFTASHFGRICGKNTLN